MKSYLLLCLITNTCIAMSSEDQAPSPPLEEPGIIELLTATFENIKAKMRTLKIATGEDLKTGKTIYRGTYYHTPKNWPYKLSVTVQDDDPIQEISYSFDTTSKNDGDEILKRIKQLAFKNYIENATHRGVVGTLDNGVAMALFYSKKWDEDTKKRTAIESEKHIREIVNKSARRSRYYR